MPAETLTVPKELSPVEVRAKKIVAEIGLDWKELTPNLQSMIIQMNKWGHLEASIRMNQLAKAIMEDPDIISLCAKQSVSPKEALRNIMQASTLSDIGKRGPLDASPKESEFISAIFEVENIIEPEGVTLADFVAEYLPGFIDTDAIMALLSRHGVTRGMSMRQFYSKHTGWSVEILKDQKIISQKVIEIVDHHHSLEVPVKNKLSLEDKSVAGLDKYDAFMTRTKTRKKSLDGIMYLKDRLKKNSHYRDDEEFKIIVEAISRVAPKTEAYKERRSEPRETSF